MVVSPRRLHHRIGHILPHSVCADRLFLRTFRNSGNPHPIVPLSVVEDMELLGVYRDDAPDVPASHVRRIGTFDFIRDGRGCFSLRPLQKET